MILVIGYGNPLCGDDGIGPHVVERIAAEAHDATDPPIEYLALRQLTPELVEPISRAETVIFVDAAVGTPPGQIACAELSASLSKVDSSPGAFTHHVNAVMLVESARFLYNQCPTAYLYTVTGESFDVGSSFSPTVELAVPRLLDELKARLAQCTNSALLKR